VLSRKSAQMRARTLGADHILYAYSLDYLADGFYLTGQLDSAAAYYRVSIAIYRRADSSTWVYMASPLKGLGGVLMKQGNCAAAEPYMREALTLREANLPPGNYVIGRAQTTLATCLIKLNRFAEAEKLLLLAFEIFENLEGQYKSSRQKAIKHLIELYTLRANQDKVDYYSSLLNSEGRSIE